MDFTSLTFTDVSRHFGRRRALNRCRLRCDAGEIVALLGANGAGKSTLLSIAATLLAPSSGERALRRPSRPRAGAALRARIGVLGHDLYLYPELSAAENLAFFAPRPTASPMSTRASTAALERAGLRRSATTRWPVLARHAPAAGARARAAARAAARPARRAVHRPRRCGDRRAADRLRRSARAAGCIVLVTTHDLETIDGVADRAVCCGGGRLTPLDGGRDRCASAIGGPA